MDKTLLRLAKLLSVLYPDEDESILFMAQIGMHAGRIQVRQQPVTRWFSIVSEANKAGLVPALFNTAIAEYPTNVELRQLQTGVPMIEAPPILIVAIGSDAALSLDLAALRAVRTATGMDFERIQDATLDSLRVHLNRVRMNGRKANVHLAVHSGPQGVELGGQTVNAVELSAILDGVGVLLIAGCESDQIGDLLGVVPYVVSFSEKITHTDASAFAVAWWTEIGRGTEPTLALQQALRRAPSSMSEVVQRNW